MHVVGYAVARDHRSMTLYHFHDQQSGGQISLLVLGPKITASYSVDSSSDNSYHLQRCFIFSDLTLLLIVCDNLFCLRLLVFFVCAIVLFVVSVVFVPSRAGRFRVLDSIECCRFRVLGCVQRASGNGRETTPSIGPT